MNARKDGNAEWRRFPAEILWERRGRLLFDKWYGRKK